MFLDNLTERTAWCTWCSWSWGGRSAFESVKHAISPSIFGAPVVSPSLVISPFFSYKNWPFMNILRNSGNIFRPIYIITPGVRALLVLLKFGCFRVECLQWPFWNLCGCFWPPSAGPRAMEFLLFREKGTNVPMHSTEGYLQNSTGETLTCTCFVDP